MVEGGNALELATALRILTSYHANTRAPRDALETLRKHVDSSSTYPAANNLSGKGLPANKEVGLTNIEIFPGSEGQSE